MALSRRALLKAMAAAPLWPALGASGCAGPDLGRFAHGVASGDPRVDGITLWTRVTPDDDEDVVVELIVSHDELGLDVVWRGAAVARADADHTVKARVAGLDPGARYYYRFAALGGQSLVGRTQTARAPDDDTPVRFALASCQDFVGHSFAAWQRTEALELDFVLFVGDWIYEYESGSSASFTPLGERRVSLPDGLVIAEGEGGPVRAATTLADYRALYRAVATDAFLMRARQLHPFLFMWDDHEFANDAWQDVANDFPCQPDEVSPARRRAATRAWLEHLPVDLVLDEERAFPDDLTTYRSFRFGRHVEVLLTDQRAYRDDHLIPEGPVDESVGKYFECSPVGSRTFVKKAGFDAREAEARPTMLGDAQQRWLTDAVAASSATWKLVGSQTMMAQLILDARARDVPRNFQDVWYFKLDQWDGFRSERAELLEAFDRVDDVVVLSGDLHGFYAGALHVDFDAPGARPAALEIVAAGISSSPVAEQLALALDENPLLAAFGLEDIVRDFDAIVRSSNPHLALASSWAVGLCVGVADGERLDVDIIEVPVETALRPAPERRTRARVQRGARALGFPDED